MSIPCIHCIPLLAAAAADVMRVLVFGRCAGAKIDAKDLRWIRPIGQGSCGDVYEALWRGTRVAVKKASVPPNSSSLRLLFPGHTCG
jgi:hypothetical protein